MRRGRASTTEQTIGDRVRAIRIENNLSIEGLAAALSTPHHFTWVSKVEKNQIDLKTSDLYTLAEALHVTPAWLVSGDADYAAAMQIVNEDEATLQAKVEYLEQQVKDADAARRALEQRPEQLQSLIDPNSTPQEKKAVLQRYLTKVIVKPGDPEPYLVA